MGDKWAWTFDRESERGIRVRFAKWLRVVRENHPELELRWKFDFGGDVIFEDGSQDERYMERARLCSDLGFPDVLIWFTDQHNNRHNIALEMKREGFYGEFKHIAEQSAWRDYLESHGYKVYIASGFDNIVKLTTKVLGL